MQIKDVNIMLIAHKQIRCIITQDYIINKNINAHEYCKD